MRFVIRGIVQGVGFRPAVYRVARSMGLRGRVYNNGGCVAIETDGDESFIDRLRSELPPLARMDSVESSECEIPAEILDFTITPSGSEGRGVGIPTDTAICSRCLEEIRGGGRRAGYAFTTCTECGARFTLMASNPYDRERTSMREFPRCPDRKSVV